MTMLAISQPAQAPPNEPPSAQSPSSASCLAASSPSIEPCLAAPSCGTAPAWHAEFLKMLPAIMRHAGIAFRDLKGERRDEAIQEAVCNACCAYARLVEQNRTQAATWSSLARYAVRQVRDGRQVGTPINSRDVCSRRCQQKKHVDVHSMYRWVEQDEQWTEMVVEDRHSTPADIAAFRVDFREFLFSLSRRDRRVAIKLAKGHATSWVAKRFRISAARVSQIRRELCEAWHEFHGELTPLGEV